MCIITNQIDMYLADEERKDREAHRCEQCGTDELFDDDEQCNDCLPCENRCLCCGDKDESIKNNLCKNCG